MESTRGTFETNASAMQKLGKETSLQECQQRYGLTCIQCPAVVYELLENSNATKSADCFFDSVAKGLNLLKVNEEFSAKTLREVCHQFALENDWVKTEIINDARFKLRISKSVNDEKIWNAYLSGVRHTAYDIEKMKRNDVPMNRDPPRNDHKEIVAAPIWGRPEIEGRMICERYSVKLHVIEKRVVSSENIKLDEIIAKLRFVSVNDAGNDRNIIHIISRGGLHFDPAFNTAQQHGFDFHDDGDTSEGDLTLNESFINTVRGCLPVGEKVKRLKELLINGANVNFKDANRKNDTPLHFAVKLCESEVVVFLTRHGANPNMKNNTGETPLSIAEQLERYDIIPLLELQSFLRTGTEIPVEESQKTFNKAKEIDSAQLSNTNLATLFLFKGLNDHIDSFCLASKVEDFDKFGDIVFKYRYRNSNISKSLFLGIEDTGDEVTTTSLPQDSESDFSLQKYFASYLRIKKRFSETSKFHRVFSSNFDDCDFLICANALPNFASAEEVAETLQQCIKEVSINDDAIFNISEDNDLDTTNRCYQLTYGKNNITDSLRYSTDCHKLAKELVESSFRGAVDVKNPIIENYRIPLVEKVLERKDPGKGKFRRSFLNNDKSLSRQDKEFRNILLKEAEKVATVSKDKIQSEICSKIMKIPSKFWIASSVEQSEKVHSLPSPVNDDDLKEFLNKLKIFVWPPNRKKLRKSIQRSMQKIYDIDSEDAGTAFSEVEKSVRDWCLNENYYLTKSSKIFQDAVRKSIRFDVNAAVSLFTGRKNKLLELHRALHEKDETVMSRTVSIAGPDGVGKSELAKKYISKYSKEYDDNIIWINAATCCTIEESFQRLAKEKLGINTHFINKNKSGIKAAVSEIYQYFAKKKRKCLFVFDDAKTMEGIDKFLPSDYKFKPFVLITSHNLEWEDITSLNLDVFTASESAEFVEKALKGQGWVQEKEIKELTELLQNIPLALSQAVAYIRMENKQRKSWNEKENVFKVSDYLRLYKDKGKKLPMLSQAQSGRSHGEFTETVFRTSTVTLDKIQQYQCGEEAMKLFNVTGFLAPGEIPVKTFFSKLISEDVLQTSAELLDQYSMIALKHGKLNVHKMVQHVIRVRLEEEKTVQNVANLTMKLLKEYYPLVYVRSEDYVKLKQLMSHLEMFLERLDNWRENSLMQRAIELKYVVVVLNWIGDGYVEMGNHRKGKEVLETALSILHNHYDPKHFKVAKMLVKLSNAYGELGSPQKQKDLAEKSLPVLEEHFGCEHIEVAMALKSLSIAYGHLGVHKEQKDLLVRVLTICVNCVGYCNPVVGTTILHLSTVFGKLGDHQRQIELIHLALPVLEKYYGSDSVKVAIALEGLGCAHGNLGDPQKQKQLQERALRILEKHFGRQNYTVSVLITNLSSAYAELGDYRTCKKLLEEALTVTDKEFGTNHFNTADVLEGLGLAFGALGNPQKQKKLLEQALSIFRRHYGPDSRRVATTLVNLSKAYSSLGDPQKQKELLQEAFPTLKQHYGHDHFMVSRVLVLLAGAHENLGDSQKAKEFLEQALPILKSHFGPEHYEVALAKCDLGRAYGTLGDPDKQKKLSEQALPILEKHYGHNSPAVAKVLVNLSKAYAEFGTSEKQKELLDQALPIFERWYGCTHYEVARVQVLLSGVYGNLGDQKKKKAILEQALPVLKEHFGSEHYEVATVLCDLGRAHGALGYPDEYEKLVQQALRILRRHYGYKHFFVALALENLADAYEHLGDHNKQKELYKLALPSLERQYGKNHYRVAMTLLGLGRAYRNLNKPHKQLSLILRALPVLKEHFGPNHPTVGMALGMLGKAWGDVGNNYIAIEHLEHSLRILEKHYGSEHYNVAVALEYLGTAYGRIGVEKKHKELLERALNITEKCYGRNHFSVGVQLRSLSAAYGALGNHKKQKDLLERALPILEAHFGRMHQKMAGVFQELGNTYSALSNHEKQAEMLERALYILEGHYGKDHPQVAKILINLSSAYEDLGDYRKKEELSERLSLIFEKHFRKGFYIGMHKVSQHSFGANVFQSEEERAYFRQNCAMELLHLATKRGDFDVVKDLIDVGFDVNMRDKIGFRTPLHFASESGYLDIVEVLSQKAANIEAGDVNASKPLHYSAYNNRQEVVKVLLGCGANVNAVDIHEKKPLDYTTSERIQRILKATSGLFDAVEERNLKKVKNLVQMGGIINAVNDSNKLSALHYAAHNSSAEIVQYLVSKGANVNVCDKDGWTPLHYAAQRGQRSIIVALLDGGADVYSRNNQGQTSLNLSLKYGNLNVLDLVFHKKAQT